MANQLANQKANPIGTPNGKPKGTPKGKPNWHAKRQTQMANPIGMPMAMPFHTMALACANEGKVQIECHGMPFLALPASLLTLRILVQDRHKRMIGNSISKDNSFHIMILSRLNLI